jgi:hypothetical protein
MNFAGKRGQMFEARQSILTRAGRVFDPGRENHRREGNSPKANQVARVAFLLVLFFGHTKKSTCIVLEFNAII